MADGNGFWSNIPIVGSVVNGIVGAVGAKKQRKWEEQMQQQQMDWNEQMMDKQNQFNVNMWNMENAYNDPSAQKERMMAAGFNPMFYGPDGTANASSMSSAQALGYERATNVANPLQAGLSSALQTLQATSQAQANIAGAKEKEANADYLASKTVSENLMRGVNFELAGLEIDLKGADIQLTKAQADKTAADIVRINKECEQIDTQIQNTIVDMDVKQRSQYLNELAFAFQKEIQSAQLSLDEQRVAIQWYNANVNAVLANSQVEVNGKQAIYLDIQGEHIKAVTQTENDMREFKVEQATWNAKMAKREYKWKPVTETTKTVGIAVGAIGAAIGQIAKYAMPQNWNGGSSQTVAGSQYMQSPVGYE